MKLKLIYLTGVRGRGEFIRYIMAQGELPYDQRLMEFFKEFEEYRKETLFNATPMLEVDGKMLAQIRAIGRFLAKKTNLTGKDRWESLRCDMLVDGADELYDRLLTVNFPLFMGQKEEYEKNYKAWTESRLVPFMQTYERLLTENGTGWFVGNQVTWADLVIAEWLDRVESCYDPQVMAKHPKLKEFVTRVHNLPRIKKYCEERPKMAL